MQGLEPQLTRQARSFARRPSNSSSSTSTQTRARVSPTPNNSPTHKHALTGQATTHSLAHSLQPDGRPRPPPRAGARAPAAARPRLPGSQPGLVDPGDRSERRPWCVGCFQALRGRSVLRKLAVDARHDALFTTAR
ncbi:uncharacterized protein K452DRAFT_285526 [Aplosporella prunicola CBS 121167]|uniref:Uncharacterized protein n=1 Tax=Aplosporella prunicola CBS 121167 TaxID=1176127 RepID=A0A6A6BLW9_9PEZI|nr:uncharacterized protein K452DRAFT_285526 [Aplosporella prunicola CBS 121167]KAF2144285.1 hypothetical protein K452DRAFT_285526 [Aplosporella prunicola CBS 121167]